MAKMIQIRNVPEDIHRALKARAALSGMSLSDYLLAELQRLVARPTREELVARLESRDRVELDSEVSELVADERLDR